MVVVCERCNTVFKTGGGFASHLRRKVPCGKEEDDVDFGDEANVDANNADADNINADNVNANNVNANNAVNAALTTNKSPLRYPGGKTRACKILEKIVNENFDLSQFDTLMSPFLGGGSFEFHMQNAHSLKVVANDKFKPLYNFWKACQSDKANLCSKLHDLIDTIDKDTFAQYRKDIMGIDGLEQSVMYFVINRCSFSGATLSGGFSTEAAAKRFTQSSINNIKKLNLTNFAIHNMDFSEFLDKHHSDKCLLFLDPPYYLESKSKLYGNNGDMHEHFDHNEFYNCISQKTNWIITYNNCDFIRNLYKDYTILDASWSYGMNKTKKSSEIVIIAK